MLRKKWKQRGRGGDWPVCYNTLPLTRAHDHIISLINLIARQGTRCLNVGSFFILLYSLLIFILSRTASRLLLSSFVVTCVCHRLSARPRRLPPECTRTKFLNTCKRCRKYRHRRKRQRLPPRRLAGFYIVYWLYKGCFLLSSPIVCLMWALQETWNT